MTGYIKKLFPKKNSTLTERTLLRFSEHKPVSKIAKGMFADETARTLSERFGKAKQKVNEVI